MRTAKPKDKRLYWRGGKLWCRVPGADGRIRRIATRCTDETAASARADELERRFADPHHAAAAAATLEGSVRAYFKDLERRGRSEATRKIAAQKCGHFLRLWGRELTMADLEARGPQMVVEYIDRRRGEPGRGGGNVKSFTIKKELEQLGQVLAIARYLGVFRRPVEEMFPPFFSSEHKPRTRKPTFEEMRRLISEFEDDRAAHIVFFFATGQRLSEAGRAHRADVDFEAGLVAVRGTKTKKATNAVPITAITRPLLEWALARAPGRDRLFRPWGKLHRDVAAACVRAGIEKATPNDFRRSFGTWHRAALAATAGPDKSAAELVSKMLRHTTDRLAQTTYADLEPADVGRALNARLEGVSGLYLGAAPTAQTEPELRTENASETAETAGATHGIRTHDLRFTKPSDTSGSDRVSRGTKLGISRAAARAADVSIVPELYAAGTVSRPAWLHEATANLYELLAGRAGVVEVSP